MNGTHKTESLNEINCIHCGGASLAEVFCSIAILLAGAFTSAVVQQQLYFDGGLGFRIAVTLKSLARYPRFVERLLL